jgi:hypothetical protein
MSTLRKLVSDVTENKYYIYRHIRIDKLEPFYIGIGSKPKKFINTSVEFSRAYNKSRRNNIWRKIISKTKYNIDILFESNDYSFIKEKEKEFISLYGRIDLKTGTLTNLTEGGEGTVGYSMSNESKIKIGANNIFKGKFGKNNLKSKKIYQYDLEGSFIQEWDSLADVGRFFNLPNKRIPTFSAKTFKGYVWHYTFLGNKIEKINYSQGLKNRLHKICIPVYQYNLNNVLICKYSSYSDAHRNTGISITGIQQAINRKNNICKDYVWTKELINL